MATYECSSCGMAVNASCAKCDQPLEMIPWLQRTAPVFKFQNVPTAKAKLSLQCVVAQT